MLVNSIQSELIKTKRSAAMWLAIIGGFFIPLIMLIGYLYNHTSLNQYGNDEMIWKIHFNRCWENMAIFLLPMGVVLASSLITQMEFKNNTWKLMHTTPQKYSTLFIAKLLVIMWLLVLFFVFFNIGVLLSAIIPSLIVDGTMPKASIPVGHFLQWNIYFFMACLPVLATQYLLSLRFKNFLVPIGVGLTALIGTLIISSSKWAWLSPYAYAILNLQQHNQKIMGMPLNIWAGLYALLIVVLAYILYRSQKEKG